MTGRTRAALIVAGTSLGLAAVRRVGHRSGAADSEVGAKLAGDDVVPEPLWQSTRATTIHAPAAAVWPLVVAAPLTPVLAG